MRRGHLGSPQGLKHSLNIFYFILSKQSWVDGKIPNGQWGVPLSHTLILSRTFFIHLADGDESALHSLRTAADASSLVFGGGGGDRYSMLKAQKNLWVFVIAASLPLFFHENFQGFYLLRLVWSIRFKLDYNVQFWLVFSFCVFFLVVGGGRWEDYRKMSSLETIVPFCSSGGTLRFVQPPSLSFPRMFFFLVVSLQGCYWNNKISFEDGSWGFLVLVFLFFGRLESSKSIPMKPRFVNAGVDLLLLQKILSF